MTTVSLTDVQKLAALSSLQITGDEAVALQKDLDQILSYIDQLGEVDVDGVEPTYQVHPLETVVRADKIKDYGVSHDAMLKNAPEKADDLIVVPKVIE